MPNRKRTASGHVRRAGAGARATGHRRGVHRGRSAVATRPVDDHPLGCHRPRIADKTCCTGIVYRLALGCSWVDAGRLVGVGQATLRRRRDEWIAAGIFDALAEEAIAGYDRIRGLDPGVLT